jgi:DNA helicase HerA-like ATPase
LIAGATGTGKTTTIQVLSEILSEASIPVVMMDIKGDFSGVAAPGIVNENITDRCQKLNVEFKSRAYPVEFLTLSNQKGTRLRATVSEFGPVLLSKILGLNDMQEGLVKMIFKYCDDSKLPLLDLKDFIKVLQFVSNEGKEELEKTYGKISTISTGTILRKVIEIQQQGADVFFGEISFDVDDLMHISEDGRGIISILRVTDLHDKPKLYSAFMLQLLAELDATCPEEGDMDKPKLVIFIDQAHLIFQEANDVLLLQIETIIQRFRSKGIGVYFCTPNPIDIPASILSQLGLKVQHALRAFSTANRKIIKQVSKNYPETEFYKTEDQITQLGIGEGLITMLNEKGIPTPLVHCMLQPPQSRMDILTEVEIDSLVSKSKIAGKYNIVVDSESAYEILNEKLNQAAKEDEQIKQRKIVEKAEKKSRKEDKTIFDDPIVKSMTRTGGNEIVRSLLGTLGLGGKSRNRLFYNATPTILQPSKEYPRITDEKMPTNNPSIEMTTTPVSNLDSANPLDELETLIGLTDVKEEVKSLINYIKIQKEREKRGLKSSQVSYHAVFTGSPGTGKTTIARIVAKIYAQLGILKKGHLVETDRSGLVAEYLGQTAIKVNKIVDSALNGVLFIDEAYSLVGENKDDYGKEAVATLIKRMEDDRDKLIIILAGYTQEMKTFINTNPGFKSRFNRYIEFKDYLPDELETIYKLQCSKQEYKLTDDAEKKVHEIVTGAYVTRDKSFGNARFVRNIFEKTLEMQANRITSIPSLTKEILNTIIAEDIPT